MKRTLIFVYSLLVASMFFGKSSNHSYNFIVAQSVNHELPKNILDFLNYHYKSIPIQSFEYKKVENQVYKFLVVRLNNEAELQFDQDGVWVEIKDKNGVPKSLIPTKILNLLSVDFPNQKIVEIEKETDKIEVDLDNDMELYFDKISYNQIPKVK